MRLIVDKADRLWKIPQPSLGEMKFAQRRLAARGVRIIDLDRLPVEPAMPEMPGADSHAGRAGVPSEPGDTLQAQLITDILAKHCSLAGVALDPETEICITPGNRIAATLLALGVLNPGDGAAHPDPGAPHLRAAICLADGIPRKYGLLDSSDYIMNIAGLKASQNKRTKLLFINYPHDPTTATVDYYFYREMIRALRFSNMLVVADCAHVHPGNPDPVGPAQVKNASDRAIELHSFAITFGIPGLGFAVGHKVVISILKGLLKTHGLSPDDRHLAVAAAALDRAEDLFQARMETLRKRREILSEGLKKFGWHVRAGRLVPFIWARPPVRSTSLSFARRLYIKAGIKVTPGSDFGENGEGWVRMTLAGDERTMAETVERLSQHSGIWQRKYRPEE